MNTAPAGDVLTPYTDQLRRLFKAAPTKHAAHASSRPILAEMARDPAVIRSALARHLRAPGCLDRGHYPVLTVSVALTADFALDMNCWIPLPTRRTDVSTKAIHHHGNMLLTT